MFETILKMLNDRLEQQTLVAFEHIWPSVMKCSQVVNGGEPKSLLLKPAIEHFQNLLERM